VTIRPARMRAHLGKPGTGALADVQAEQNVKLAAAVKIQAAMRGSSFRRSRNAIELLKTRKTDKTQRRRRSSVVETAVVDSDAGMTMSAADSMVWVGRIPESVAFSAGGTGALTDALRRCGKVLSLTLRRKEGVRLPLRPCWRPC
jgi:hypothetical protein